eukprot:2132943-Rhodomonas_salina.1
MTTLPKRPKPFQQETKSDQTSTPTWRRTPALAGTDKCALKLFQNVDRPALKFSEKAQEEAEYTCTDIANTDVTV